MNDRDNPYQAAQGTQMTGNVSFGAAGPQPGGLSGLGGGAAPDTGNDLIKDTTTSAFSKDVIQESRNQPVLVDFWAPWCGPCKQLAPMIEKAVREAGGSVKLVKLNIDDHPAIPGQMGIQSIPAVIAFVDGQPVDGFMGAVPESQIRQFIDRLGGSTGADEAAAVEAMLDQAGAALSGGDVNAAAQIYTALLQREPGDARASAGMAECLLAAGRPDEAKALLGELDDDARGTQEVASILARIAQMEEVGKLGDPAALEARLAGDPDDHAARRDLAKILNVKGDREAATDHLLQIMRKDRTWEDDGARRELLAFFEAWGPTDPATLSGRRKLSSILFS